MSEESVIEFNKIVEVFQKNKELITRKSQEAVNRFNEKTRDVFE